MPGTHQGVGHLEGKEPEHLFSKGGGKVHVQDQQTLTIPCKVTSHCGSVQVLLILTPRGTVFILIPASYGFVDTANWVTVKSFHLQF